MALFGNVLVLGRSAAVVILIITRAPSLAAAKQHTELPLLQTGVRRYSHLYCPAATPTMDFAFCFYVQHRNTLKVQALH